MERIASFGITGPNITLKRIHINNQTKNKMNKWNMTVSKYNNLNRNYFTKKLKNDYTEVYNKNIN